MKKRLLAALLCVAMVATLVVGCTGPAETPHPQPSTGTEEGSEPDSQKPEPSGKLSVEPVVYYPFESTDEGWKVVVADGSKAANNAYDATNIDGSRGIIDGDVSLVKNKGGVKGNSLFLDRNYAIDLNFDATNTDAWAVSFWLCTTGMTNYMPSLQMGNNIGYKAFAGNNVTWLNVTQTDWVGATFPVLWSRNEDSSVKDENGNILLNDKGENLTDCFPWMSAYDNEKLIYGLKEWVHITIVATGDVYTAPNGIQAAGAQLYINGELRYDSFDNYNNATYFEVTDGLATMAPNIMKPAEGQTFEAYFGINYWDNLFKGCVDEFYVFNQAITADDVATLYAMGDANAEVPEMYDPNDPKENAPELPDANSIQFVGLNNYTQGWWTTFSDIHEVAAGTTKTITFKNYHTNLNFSNWNNAAVILQSTPEGHSADTAGYSEYAVVRMDHHGWCGEKNTADHLADLGWTLSSDWDWATFKDVTHGATVECAITNHGTTADIVMTITAVDGTVHHQSYTGIAVNGPVYACFTVEKACIDIIEIK